MIYKIKNYITTYGVCKYDELCQKNFSIPIMGTEMSRSDRATAH
jgi:hypothetical protein